MKRRAEDFDPSGYESWHLHKATTLTILGFIFGLIGVGFSGFLTYRNEVADIHSNEAVFKEQIKVLHERDDKAFAEMRDAMTLLRDQYKDISLRLDRLIERRASK